MCAFFRRWLSRSAALASLLYTALCLTLYVLQEQLLFAPVPLAPDATYQFYAPHEDVFLPVENATLHAAYFPAPDPQGAILYLHGAGGNLAMWGLVAPGFVRRGYEVLMIDYRGFGKSDGSITDEAMLHADAATAYAWLQQRYPEEQITIYGRSLGSGLALALGTQFRPRAIILEAPYYSLEALVAHRLPLIPPQLLKYPLRSHSWIGAVQSPVAIVHGTADTVVPYAEMERLAAVVPASVAVYPIEGAGHDDIGEFDAYYVALRELLGPWQEP